MNDRLPPAALTATTPLNNRGNAQGFSEKESTVFMSGNSQAVRIPKEFQFKTKQVKIVLRDGELVIKPKYRTGAEILANLPPLSDEDQNDDFDLAALVGKSNTKLPAERDLSHLLAKAARNPRATTARLKGNSTKAMTAKAAA